MIVLISEVSLRLATVRKGRVPHDRMLGGCLVRVGDEPAKNLAAGYLSTTAARMGAPVFPLRDLRPLLATGGERLG